MIPSSPPFPPARRPGLFFLFPLALVALSGQPPEPAAPPHIVFLAGEASHGWNEHKYPEACAILARCLQEAGLGLTAEVIIGWPSDPAPLDAAHAIVLYGDGEARHLARGHASTLRRHFLRGAGLAVLHYALDPDEPDLAALFRETLGGVFAPGYSVNPLWTPPEILLAPHPITTAVAPFTLKDEWYFHLRFDPAGRTLTPLLTGHPPASLVAADGPRSGNPAVRAALAAGQPQTFAWASEDSAGRRAFGFTGGHFLHHLNHPDYRRFLLQGLAWTARSPIPPGGLQSTVLGLVQYESLPSALAAGDLDDLRRHLERDPAQLNLPGRAGMTPLHLALLRKNEDAAALLLSLGAAPDPRNDARQTPLHLAVARNLPASAALLLAAGADPTLLDGDGWSPLHRAAAENRLDLARLLLRHGVDPNLRSAAGGTPLHEAAPSAGSELISLLLQAGCDPAIRSHTGHTALDHAREFQNAAAISLLSAAIR